MSGPSSEGRQSFSSEPSATSSHTLNSRYSGVYEDNGEGSSSQRASTAYNTLETRARNSDSPLSIESIEEQDFAHRKQRNRRSGGFLLDSSFGSGPRNRHSYNGERVDSLRRKQSSHRRQALEEGNQQGSSRSAYGVSNGSPLSRDANRDAADRRSRVGSADVQGQGNGNLQVPRTRTRLQDMQSTTSDRGAYTSPAAPTIDPTQIVHMALNLSESRRRNLNAGQLISQPRVSSVIQQDGSFGNRGAGGSLRQYLNEQRRTSRNISPHAGGSSPMQRSGSGFVHGRPLNPSEATLVRRDRARSFFELRIEYLRLLELLPPLKPDSSEPGNFIVTANNVPGSPHAYLSRVPSYAGKKYELGRPYNPLQFLRNRRTRARERKTLEHPSEEFTDVERVRDWVDRVERASQHPQYRQQDRVSLPRFHDDHEMPNVPSKPPRPNMIWFFTAEELLADAHWLEHGDNKTVIEDRHGRNLFPPREPQKQDSLQPRSSKDYPDKRRRSWVEGVPGITADPATGDESDAASERGRRRRLLPTFRAESPKHKKHIRGSSRRRSGSYSESSDSGSDTRQPRKSRKAIDVNNNTGPLELRIKELMEKEAREAQVSSKSPALFTPGTPDKWGREGIDVGITQSSRNSLEVPHSANGSARPELGLKLPLKQRADTNISIDPSKEARSSFEGFDSTAPNSPLYPRHLPHGGSDLSPPPSRGGSLRGKPKKSKLDIFRSDESTKAHKKETRLDPDSANSDKRHSRHVSEEIEEGNGFSSAIWTAPGAVKNLLGHRKNDSVSSLPSPVKQHRRDDKDLKEPPSAVTRFFKGVKNESSKMGEFIFRRDRPPEDSDTDSTSEDDTTHETDSDEDTSKRERKRRPNILRSATAETVGSLHSKKNSRYHLELPSFRSANQTQTKDDGDTAYASDSHLTDHPITRQARERANSRSARFDELAPPRMDLSRISSKASPSSSDERINKVLAHPGGVGQGGLPVTALSKGQVSEPSRRPSRPTLEGQRHWSITDNDGHVLHRKITTSVVTQADIARVRALFLCSGVKAREIVRRAHEVRPHPAPFLTRAAKTANARLMPISKKEEHVLAARILVNNLNSSTHALQASTEEFRESTVKELTSMIAPIRERIETDLLARVRNSADEAVKITSEVSSNAPLAVKQITDEVDRMLRVRRRRMRWVRRLGWTMVEWMLLGFMWFAWLLVTVSAFTLRVIGFTLRVVRWLLWI